MATETRSKDSLSVNLLDAQLERLGLDRSEPPDAEDWAKLLDGIDEACSLLAEADGVEGLLRHQVLSRRASQTHLFEQSPVPIIQIDLSPLREHEALERVMITAANQAADRLLGLGAEGKAASTLESLELDVSAVEALVELVRTEATSVEVELEGRRPCGATYEALLMAAVPLPFGIPDYSRVVVSMIDISEHKAEERRIRELVASKSRLLASATSEIRSPLSEVIDFARLLGEPTDEPTRSRDLAHAIAEGAARVAGIVDDLLVVSRSELGDLAVAEVPVDLSAQVAQVLEVGGDSMSAVATPGRNVEPRVCLGDPARVRQIVRNLIVDSIRRGGDDVAVTIHRRASTLLLVVSSDGPPIPDRLTEQVFDRDQGIFETPIDAEFVTFAVARQLALKMGGDLKYRLRDRRREFELSLRAAPTAGASDDRRHPSNDDGRAGPTP